jgi:PadR family transcriptional regulator, regulatory protein PadR
MTNSSFFDNWTTQLRKGLLEFCILNALRTERRYGYDIVRILRNVDGLVIGEGTIYPLLNRLKQEGIVRATLQESPEGPARKYYHLTDFGVRRLHEMNAYWKKVQSGIAELAKESNK